MNTEQPIQAAYITAPHNGRLIIVDEELGDEEYGGGCTTTLAHIHETPLSDAVVRREKQSVLSRALREQKKATEYARSITLRAVDKEKRAAFKRAFSDWLPSVLHEGVTPDTPVSLTYAAEWLGVEAGSLSVCLYRAGVKPIVPGMGWNTEYRTDAFMEYYFKSYVHKGAETSVQCP